MADEQGQQQAQPAEKQEKKTPLTDIIANRWSSEVATPAVAFGIGGVAHHFLGLTASIPAAGFGLGYLVEQHVKQEGKSEIKTEKLLPEVATGAGVGAGILYGSKLASNIPKALGLEAAVSGAFGSLGNLGVGAGTFGLLALGLPLLYYPMSHILNKGTAKGMWKDLKENYFILNNPFGLFSISSKRCVHSFIIANASFISPQPSTSTCLFSRSL
jgi:hypothetical protein